MGGPINLELFCCAGGMAEGFRRAGVRFDVALDFAPDHCDSYERNLGHRPIAMDVRDTLRMVRAGHLRWDVDLLVADPPCTPWSRAGKRLGTADERDMLEVTCELIAALRPRRYLIGNVPGLDDAVNLAIVRRHIGGLGKHGYCVADFARLDAANYGVPQHRVRPFWFGHLAGPCIRWSAPTHCDPLDLCSHALPGIEPLKPWVTCRQALGHLAPDDLGRPVKMRKRNDHGAQGPQSTRTISPDAPATTVQAREDRVGSGSPVLDWPWPRPATTVTCRPGLAPPGHYDESFAILSLPDAVILSERAAAILQGFPEGWHFAGDTKKARWEQIGQAMPPALAEAVARSVVDQDKATRKEATDAA